MNSIVRHSVIGICCAAVSISICSSLSRADTQNSYPMLMGLNPVAAQIGQSSEHEVDARYSLDGSYQIIVSGTGVTGEVVPPENPPEDKTGDKDKAGDKKRSGRRNAPRKLKIRLTVSPDAIPGVRDFRIATPLGVSTIGQLVVVRDPIVSEQTDNNTVEKAQEFALPATLCGRIERNEDVDFYKFKVDAGTALSFHVRCARLEDKIHDLQAHADPILTLRNSQGATLAVSDNHFFADPFLKHRFDQAGEYLLEVRDLRYHGNGDWNYSIEVNSRPFVTNVFPMGVSPGGNTPVELVGFQIPANSKGEVTLPAETRAGPWEMSVPLGDQVLNPVPVFVSSLPLVTEAAAENNTPASAQSVTTPAGISGRIESEGDIDCFSFPAKKGETFEVELVARRLQSALDSNLRILNDKGQQLAENDDARFRRVNHADSHLASWTAPADGNYILEIRDVHRRGGPEFVYFVQLTRPQPAFELLADSDKALLVPGGNAAIFVRAERSHGFAGEVQLGIEGLPAGITAQCGKILGERNDGCIILHAADDASLCAANIRIIGTGSQPAPSNANPPAAGTAPAEGAAVASAPAMTLTAAAIPLQEIYFPGGGRGHWPMEMFTVSVSKPLDILSVKLSQNEISLKPGESKKVDVTIVRAPGFTENVMLDVFYRHLGNVFGDTLPKGVTLDEKSSQTLLTSGQSTGSIVLVADKSAKPVERQLVSVMANVSINFVMKMSYSAEPLSVSVISE